MTRQHRTLFLGKWFNYGLLVLVLILDLNMWKNQILYKPEYYGQYTGKNKSVLIVMKCIKIFWFISDNNMFFTYTSAIHNRVFTVTDQSVLLTGDPSQWNFNARSQINPKTNFTFMDGKHFTNLSLKGVKFSIKLY